jgi:muconate cycloisomerase
MGSAADIRVDANCAWSAEEALTAIERMRPYGISGVEQPVAADDIAGLRRVTAETEETIIVDESLISLDGAERLVDGQACDAFNIRLSKVGGLLEARRIAEVAHEAGIDVVVGAQVGETGLLSAAGRHLAATIPDLRHAEGSFGALLLKQDITRERVFPLRRGRAGVFSGPGLGVQVNPDAWRERTAPRYRAGPAAISGAS